MSDRKAELEELETIRKLLILGLVRLGLTQDDLGLALGIHRTTIARMFPPGLLKEIAKKA